MSVSIAIKKFILVKILLLYNQHTHWLDIYSIRSLRYNAFISSISKMHDTLSYKCHIKNWFLVGHKQTLAILILVLRQMLQHSEL